MLTCPIIYYMMEVDLQGVVTRQGEGNKKSAQYEKMVEKKEKHAGYTML